MPFYKRLLAQQGWVVLPPIIIIVGIRGTLHSHTINCLEDLYIAIHINCKIMKTLSQIAFENLTHVTLNKRKLENHQKNTY